jgi:hypothetical protein
MPRLDLTLTLSASRRSGIVTISTKLKHQLLQSLPRITRRLPFALLVKVRQ